jgi:formiminotetrahydrofolate cyclodeaminase
MDMRRFLERLSSATPTPGGGSAAALAGGLSASLVAMVAGLSANHRKPKQKELMGVRKKALALQGRFLRAMEEDAASYEKVIEAYRLPKDTRKEHLARSKAIQRAYRNAIVTPRLVSLLSIQLFDLCEKLLLKGKKSAMSDVGVAAFLADSALRGGMLNIRINLISVNDRVFIKKMHLLHQKLERKRSLSMGKIETVLRENFLRGPSQNVFSIPARK